MCGIAVSARQGRVRLVGAVVQAECNRPLELELRAPLACGKERGGAAEQADGGGDVTRAPDAHPCLAEPLAGAGGELACVFA